MTFRSCSNANLFVIINLYIFVCFRNTLLIIIIINNIIIIIAVVVFKILTGKPTRKEAFWEA